LNLSYSKMNCYETLFARETIVEKGVKEYLPYYLIELQID